MINPVIKKNDKLAAWLIGTVSVVVFVVVVILGRVKVEVDLGFDKHVFAKINAMINSAVAVLLLLGLWFVKSKKFLLHKRMMMLAILLSVGFLLPNRLLYYLDIAYLFSWRYSSFHSIYCIPCFNGRVAAAPSFGKIHLAFMVLCGSNGCGGIFYD